MRVLTLAIALCAAACATPPAPSAPSAPPPATEAPDPWALTIEAGRWGVLIDLATEGAALDLSPVEPTAQERIDADLRRGVLAMYRLRDRVCRMGLVEPEECGPLPAPAWLGDRVGEPVSLTELQARSDWLAETASPFIAAGCEAGNARHDHGMFCAVE